MKNYLSFLYYYTFIAIVCAFIWAFFWGPKPEGLLLIVLLIPISLYFSIKISRRGKIEQGVPLPSKAPFLPPLLSVIILTVLFVSAFSIYSYLLIGNLAAKNSAIPSYQIAKEVAGLKEEVKKLNSSAKNSNDISSKEIEQIKQQIANAKASNQNLVLGENISTSSALVDSGFITVKDKSVTVNMYEKESATSKITGTLKYGQDYLYSKKDGLWYFVMTIEGTQGWVNSQFIKISTVSQ